MNQLHIESIRVDKSLLPIELYLVVTADNHHFYSKLIVVRYSMREGLKH